MVTRLLTDPDHVTVALGDGPAAIKFFAALRDPLLVFDPVPGPDPGEHPTNLRRRGYNHLAFRVDDIEAVSAHLLANGVKMLSDEMDYISRKLRFFEGPEQITLELVEWVDTDNR